MKKVLFAWVGQNDLDAAANDGVRGLGAICQAATTRRFDEISLISDWPPEKTDAYRSWLEKRISSSVVVRPVKLGNPTDIRGVYGHSKREVAVCLENAKSNIELTFHLSSGTWAMAAVWIILANSFFPAELIKTSKEEGLQDVDFPFDLAPEYIPELLKRRDEGVGRLFDRDDSAPQEFRNVIHRSLIMKRLVARAQRVAPHPVPVLIMGESGTGKELLAEAIHNASLRKGKFVAVNCGAISPGLVESELFGHKKGAFTGADSKKDGFIKAAAGGTLFLDEIGELPLEAQVKLLRVLQEGTFSPVGETVTEKTDARIVAATNRNLADEVAAGRFREDLFYRLAVAILHVPPLREREGDIGLLVDHLLESANRKLAAGKTTPPKKLSAAARSLLLQHDWPGNVRELQNTLIRAALWADENTLEKQDIQEALLPVARKAEQGEVLWRPLGEGLDLENIMSDVACHYLERAMKETGGNKSKAAKLIGFNNYQTLTNWLKKYELNGWLHQNKDIA